MRPVDADGERAPDDDDWARPPSPVLLADGRDVAALEREHVRAHLRARRRLREIEGLLDEMKSEVEASEAGALDPAGSAGAAAEDRGAAPADGRLRVLLTTPRRVSHGPRQGCGRLAGRKFVTPGVALRPRGEGRRRSC